jgi:hypothetical protein
LEQAIRRIVLTGHYDGDTCAELKEGPSFAQRFTEGRLTAKELIEQYCRHLYDEYGNYGKVARQTGLDWRTVKKYVAD